MANKGSISRPLINSLGLNKRKRILRRLSIYYCFYIIICPL
jgi:hypothetical protein